MKNRLYKKVILERREKIKVNPTIFQFLLPAECSGSKAEREKSDRAWWSSWVEKNSWIFRENKAARIHKAEDWRRESHTAKELLRSRGGSPWVCSNVLIPTYMWGIAQGWGKNCYKGVVRQVLKFSQSWE